MKILQSAFWLPLCTAALAGVLIGCGSEPAYDGPPRIPISGKVTLDGQPIDGGTISFLPQNQDQRPAGGPIVNGEYSVPREKGGNEGRYRVQINWLKPTGQKVKDSDTGGMVDVAKESVPSQFNTASTLEVTLSEENNVHNFDLKSK